MRHIQLQGLKNVFSLAVSKGSRISHVLIIEIAGEPKLSDGIIKNYRMPLSKFVGRLSKTSGYDIRQVPNLG
jgi:hypothetical protein